MVTVLNTVAVVVVVILITPFVVYTCARLATYGVLDGKRSYEQNLGEGKHEDEASTKPK